VAWQGKCGVGFSPSKGFGKAKRGGRVVEERARWWQKDAQKLRGQPLFISTDKKRTGKKQA